MSNTHSGWLTDIYDGQLWKEWARKDGKPFLDVPGNLLLMMNVDWFRPFKHSTYSIGVIYLVVQNLPRSLRYKLENVIIIGVIPGPHEPKNTINTYLMPMIEDLLRLWKGVKMQTPGSMFSMKTIRAALGFISSDIPATRKVCGFYGLKATKGCSKCLTSFNQFSNHFGSGTNYSGYNCNSWDKRDLNEHRSKTLLANSARTKAYYWCSIFCTSQPAIL